MNVSAHPARLIQTEVKATDRALRERILPEDRLSKSATLDEVPPSLRSHYRTFNTTTRYSVPVPRIGTQALVGASHLRGSLYIGATGSHVPHQSLDQGHATCTPDAAWAVSRFRPDSSRKNEQPPVLTPSLRFRRFISGSLSLVSFDPYLTRSSPAFFLNAHHTRHLTDAA